MVRGATHNELLDTFRVLRTRVLQRLEAANYTTLGIVSANKGDGKTVTAINLAVSFAMNVDKTVLLVDADLRSPRIHQYFGLRASPGLQDYLLADVPLSNCLVHPNIDRMVILPALGVELDPEWKNVATWIQRLNQRASIHDLAGLEGWR